MPELMAYSLLTSTLVGLAALAMERILAAPAWPRRGVWVLSLVFSIALPAAAVLSPRDAPRYVAPPALDETAALMRASAEPGAPVEEGTALPPQHIVAAVTRYAMPVSREFEEIAGAAWAVSTLILLAFCAAAALHVRRIAAGWPVVSLDGVNVRVSEHAPPAVLGWFRPQIAVPRWLLTAPPDVRAMVLAHEREHIAARDPLLMLGALLLTVFMPWNLPLWWQVRRLRFAIEADCDMRVLRTGVDAAEYGEMLLSLAGSRSPAFAGTLAMVDRRSRLQRRIRLLLARHRWPGKAVTSLLAVTALSLVAVASQVEAPARPGDELRKLPPEDISPGAQWARLAARERFPELFEEEFEGTAVVWLAFAHDGTLLYGAYSISTPDLAPPRVLAQLRHHHFDRMGPAKHIGAETQDIAYGGDETDATIGPWLESKNPGRINIVYSVLRWPIDPSRSAARVQAAVAQQFPEVLRDSGNAWPPPYLTVFMNDDGTVARTYRHSIVPDENNSYVLPDVAGIEFFEAMGIPADELGRRGMTMVGGVMVGYAWPRRPDDDPGNLRSKLEWRPTGEDTADDAAIIRRYFPEAYRHELPDGASRWLLMDRDGPILGTGQGVYPDTNVLQAELDTRFPELEPVAVTGRANCLGDSDAERRRLRVHCAWLAPGSPQPAARTIASQ